MPVAGNLEDVARLIQLAVVPIFLLTAVSTTLMVLIGRLARIVDRGRSIEARVGHEEEIQRLERRAHIIYRSIFMSVSAAILICVLMTLAFMGELFRFNPARSVAILFVGALFAYTGSLTGLLQEVFIAIASFKLRLHPQPIK